MAPLRTSVGGGVFHYCAGILNWTLKRGLKPQNFRKNSVKNFLFTFHTGLTPYPYSLDMKNEMESPSSYPTPSLTSPLAWTVLVWALVGISGALFATGRLTLPTHGGASFKKVLFEPLFNSGPKLPSKPDTKGSRLT